MSKRGRKSKAGTLDFWNSKEGKRQIARQLKAEDVSASVQRKAADARLLEDGWVRSPPLSGQYVQKSDVATAAYNSLSAEAQSAIQDAGKHGKNYGATSVPGPKGLRGRRPHSNCVSSNCVQQLSQNVCKGVTLFPQTVCNNCLKMYVKV